MVMCRNHPSPFEVLMDRSVIKDWRQGLQNYIFPKPVTKGNLFKIQKYVILKYKTDGTLLCSPFYSSIFSFIPFSLWNKRYSDQELKCIKLTNVDYAPVKAAKEKDVRDLYKYLDEESFLWLDNMFEESKQ